MLASISEIHDGRDGEGEITQDKRTIFRYTRVFRAVTTSRYDDATIVLAGCPAYGSAHPFDPRARLRKLSPKNAGFSKKVWIVTASYSSEKELDENPLDEPAEIDWDTDQGQKPYTKDRDGEAILNAAGDPYDPPLMGDKSRWTATITKNVGAIPEWFGPYKDAINSDTFTLDGLSIDPKQAKLTRIRIGKWQERNEIAYRVLTMSIQYEPEGWDPEALEAGLECLFEGEKQKCVDAAGEPVKKPALLRADGTQILNPTPADAVYTPWGIYPLKPFAVLPLT